MVEASSVGWGWIVAKNVTCHVSQIGSKLGTRKLGDNKIQCRHMKLP